MNASSHKSVGQPALDPIIAPGVNDDAPIHPVPFSSPAHSQPGNSTGAVSVSQPASALAQSIVTPGQQSQSSQSNSHRAAYLGDSGYMSIFTHETVEDEGPSQPQTGQNPDFIPPVLQESYLDTFLEFGYTWCPILDREVMQTCPDFSDSLLLRQALALFGSNLSPPLMAHAKPLDHYLRCRQLFYDDQERQPLVRICAIMLLYWWSSGPPNVVSIDTNWWWMGASIRLAQEIGLYREQDSDHLWQPGETPGLRRRIWWTLFVGIGIPWEQKRC